MKYNNLIISILKDPLKIIRGIGYVFLDLIALHLSDITYLRCKWFIRFGRKLNLKNPKSFNEKLQWLKLYDHNPKYTQMVDKFEAKQYVASIIGEEYIIPTIAVYDKVEEIDFDALPNQFVLKCTHDSGGIVICDDKNKLDKKTAIRKLRKGLRHNFYWKNREWPYKNVKPRIIAEKYLTDGQGLIDYKIHSFNSVPKVVLVCQDRFLDSGMKEDFFSDKWEHLNISRPDTLSSTKKIEKPCELDKLLDLSRTLSQDIPFIRTDFYIVNNKIYFGELTFFPASGFKSFIPKEWNFIFGEWLILPKIGNN